MGKTITILTTAFMLTQAAAVLAQPTNIQYLQEENRALRKENEKLRALLRPQLRGISTLNRSNTVQGATESVVSIWDSFSYDSRTRDKEQFKLNLDDKKAMDIEIQALGTPFTIKYNEEIRKYLEIFTIERRKYMPAILARYWSWHPTFKETFDSKGVPECITMLALVESAVSARAVSSAGAVGMWQFLYETAINCGLKITDEYDERLDPKKSTAAAATYLSRAYKRFGNWELAVMSYNCGAGAIENAISKCGGKRDYESMKQYLPKETREYLPALIAALLVGKYAEDLEIIS